MPASSSTSSSKAGKFFRYTIIFLLVVIAFDQGFGRLLQFLYFKQKSGPDAETTFVLTKMNQDVLIIGSSRGRRNYDPKIISDSLGLSCYDAGHDGQTIFFEQAVIRTALSRYTPKLVVIDLNPEEMYYRDLHYDRLNVLAPYYFNYPEVRSIYLLKGVRDREPDGNILVKPSPDATQHFWTQHLALEEFALPINTEKIKMLSRIYPFNSTVMDMYYGLRGKKTSASGFQGLKGVITPEKAAELIKENADLRLEPDKVVDQNKLSGLEEIISSLTSRGCKVVVSMSPSLAPFAEEPSYLSIQQVCSKYNVPFKDYSQDSIYNHLEYFADNHLNKTGADFFTSHLAYDIKTEFFSYRK